MTKVYSEQNDNNEETQHSINDDVNGMQVLEQLISNEENYTANVLLKCLKLCPSAFGGMKYFIISNISSSNYMIFCSQKKNFQLNPKLSSG